MRTLNLLFLLALLFNFTSCGNNTAATEDTTEDSTTEEEMDKYVLSPIIDSPEFPDAKIESMDYQNGQFTFGIGGSTYELKAQTSDADQKMCANSDEGQHIHLIIDNEPYAAKYDPTFEYDISDGEHYLLAFLSRSYHESIKTSDASVIKKINVADKAIESSEDVTEPMLFYSRPKGTYVGKEQTANVMLDFYLANVELGTDYKVKADINGEPHIIREWEPMFISNLPMGENKITLTLLDKDDKPVDTPLNPVTRTFTLKEDPAETE